MLLSFMLWHGNNTRSLGLEKSDKVALESTPLYNGQCANPMN
jgi:hypothetical protein